MKIRSSVQGRNQEVGYALEALEEANKVRKEERGNAKRYSPVMGNDSERYGRESNGE
jgi:DNA-binding transcriptional ArsR family regulator